MKTLMTDLNPGEVTLVAARPGVGKTALALSLAMKSAKEGVGVLYYSLQMPVVGLAFRLLKSEVRVAIKDCSAGAEGDEKTDMIRRVNAASAFFRDLPIYVEDEVAGVSGMIERIEAVFKKHKIGMVIIDYLQLCADPNSGENMIEALVKIAEMARGVSGRIVVLSQLKYRSVGELLRGRLNIVDGSFDHRPQVSDHERMDEVDPIVDNIWLLRREKDESKDYLVVDVVKNSKGAVREICLPFDMQFGMVEGVV